ncbi:MAG: hypothetical protein P1V97_22735, partial [Planctomycetota bacterium]|nr:hypothetical protein [Planctomycetota bacterium]
MEDSKDNSEKQDKSDAENVAASAEQSAATGESELVAETNLGSVVESDVPGPAAHDPIDLEDTHINLDFSDLPDDGGFDTVGFDYNPDALEKTPASGTPLADFSMTRDENGDTPASGTPLPPPTTA